MRSSAMAMAWQFWHRYRWWYLAGLAYFLVLLSLQSVLPTDWIGSSVALGLSTPLILGLACLAAVFSFGTDSDLTGPESCYPARLLSLPLPTNQLVGWPMLLGAATIVACSLAMVVLIGRSADLPVPAYLPVMSLAAGLAWLQALLWLPFGLPWVRLPVVLAVVSAMTALPVAGQWAGVPSLLVLVVLVVQLSAAYLVALGGVSRARCGAVPSWRRLWTALGTVAGRLPRRRGAFRSAAHAQLWLEWRLNGVALPFITAFFLLFFAALILMNQHNHRMAADSLLRSPLLLFLLAPWIALTAGFHFGNLPTVANDRMISPFIATRPIRATDIVLAKFRAAAISVVALFAMTLIVVLALFAITDSAQPLVKQWGQLALELSPLKRLTILLTAACLLLVGTWKLAVENIAAVLAGREWLQVVFVVAVGTSVGALFLLGCWLACHPHYLPLLWKTVPWALGALATVKLLLARSVLQKLTAFGMMTPRTVTRLATAWFMVAIGLIALVFWLTPMGLFRTEIVVPGVVLALPGVRLGCAPLALAWNRHR